jgi:hypothetical protein
MSNSVSIPQWGPITWMFFHTIAEKIKDSQFNKHKAQIFALFKLVCSNLPCPYCVSHATEYLKQNNITLVKSKYDLQLYFFQFHNNVNIQHNKPAFVVNDLVLYRTANLKPISKYFLLRFTANQYNRLMNEQMHRISIGNKIRQWLYTYSNIFNL